jgi:peptidoglycan/xylan/chitin deacetylase (PgdA/CDA1 family)
VVTLLLAFIVVSSSLTINVSLADSEQPHGVISLTFDDGFLSQYTTVFPILQSYGVVGTFYIPTVLNGDGEPEQIPISGLLEMQAAGNEIGSHSVDHPDFTELNDSQIAWECSESKATLQSWGLTVTDFAYPYGTGDLSYADTIVSQYYRSARTVFGDLVTLPATAFEIPAFNGEYTGGGDLSEYEDFLSNINSIIDDVAANNQWATFYLHNVGSNLPDVLTYGGIYVDDFTVFLEHIITSGVKIITVNQALNLISPPAPPPSVSIDPTSVEMDVGQYQTFSSSVFGGNPNYVYQWYLNGTSIPGATNNTWNFSPVAIGNYEVYLNVTDALSYEVQSNLITDIMVYPPLNTSINPVLMNMVVGATQTFNSSAEGGNTPYFYQWYQNESAISGAIESTWDFIPTEPGNYVIYLNTTDNLNCQVQSNKATINVYTQPSTTINPTRVRITIGATRQFTSTTIGGLIPYKYQWYLNDSAATGATSSIWNFTPSIAGHYKIYLNITDALGNQVQSNIVTKIIANPKASIMINPISANITVGLAQTFGSNIIDGTKPYIYQWYINGTSVIGETHSNYTFIPTTAGTYKIYLNVTDNTAVTTQSNTATIKVETPMTINITPTQTKMYTGQTQTFTSTISGGTAPYTCQWYLNDTAIPGANSSAYTFTPKTAGHYKVYLNITDAFSFKIQSNVNNVLVCSIYLQLTTNPNQNQYLKGQTMIFTINVFNEQDPLLETSLLLTITGPKNYGYLDVQPISVKAGTVGQYSFTWIVPNISGKYVIEIELTHTILTAYDTAWLNVN